MSTGDDREALIGAFHEMCQRIAENDATVVDIDDRLAENFTNWTNDDLVMLGESLIANTHLKSLKLAFSNPDRNCTASRAVKAIRKGIAKSQVQSLHFRRLSHRMHKCILKAVERSPKIHSLGFDDATVIDVCAMANLLAAQGVQQPPDPLTNKKCQLTCMSLTFCRLDNLDMLTLSLGMDENRSLVSLHLDRNFISNMGIIYFCQHWRNDSPLQELTLNNNNIGSNGALHLLLALTQHPAMETLNIGDNSKIGCHGLQRIAELLPQIRLKNLDIEGNIEGKWHRGKVSTPETQEAARLLADGLRINTTLENLFVGENDFGPRGAQMIMQAAANHPTLRELSFFRDETIAFAGLKHIGNVLPPYPIDILAARLCGFDLA